MARPLCRVCERAEATTRGRHRRPGNAKPYPEHEARRALWKERVQMISDQERREVAAKLRGLDEHIDGASWYIMKYGRKEWYEEVEQLGSTFRR